MDLSAVEAQDLCIRYTKQNRWMRYYDELGVFFGTACYVKEKGKLSLWRQGCFGLIEKIYSIRFELILSNGKEAFSMRLSWYPWGTPPHSWPYQSFNVIIDLQRCKLADEDALKDIRYHYKISKRIKRLKVIMKDKNIIDISWYSEVLYSHLWQSKCEEPQ